MLNENQKSFVIRFTLSLVLVAGMLGIETAGIVHASTLVVINTNDSGAGSLRQAIADAVSGDIITFDSSLGYYSIISLFSPLIVDKDLTIDGSALANQLPLDLRNSSNIQILNSSVTILNLTIQRGYSNGDGGAIWSNGNLTIINSTIKDSYSGGNGGGIYSSETLIVKSSALYQNEARLNGGGLFTETLGELTQIVNTTISRNIARQMGGGVSVAGNTILSVINSTIAQNVAVTAASEIDSQDQSEITFSNSVVACWLVSVECVELHAPPLSMYSTIGTVGKDYGLLELADNGGPTRTMALLASSPLVDAGNDAVCANPPINNKDQRGQLRPKGMHCDMGAYEVGYLTISGHTGIDGATLSYGYGLFTVADNSGNYSIKVLPGWSGMVVPTKLGYSFTPAKGNYTNMQGDQLNQDYLATVNAYHYSGNPGDTWRVSVASNGTQSNDSSFNPSISADGRYVAFMSYARNLINGDVSGATDILVHDNQTGETKLASIHSDGMYFDANSYYPSISADGRYVAFASFEWFGTQVVFLHDRQTGITDAIPFAQSSGSPSISADGRYIAYIDFGSLTSDDTNNANDVFLYDVLTTDLTRVSVSSNGEEANGASSGPSISADGRYVAFGSSATNLVNGDTNGVIDVFVRDLQTGATTRLSVDSNGLQANGDSYTRSISANGRYVAFVSSATNLVANDTNGMDDVFVHDLQTGVTTRVSVDSNGMQGNDNSGVPKISGDGRFVAFSSLATNLVSGDKNGTADIFVHDRLRGITKRMSVSSDGGQANGSSPADGGGYLDIFSMSSDGRFISFSSDATDLISGDTNGYSDIFVHDITAISIIPLETALPPTPMPRPLVKSWALTPASITTQYGTMSGSRSSLSLSDQSGLEDDPVAYVSFQTPNSLYSGYQSFILPGDVQTKLVSTMLLQVNFKGPASSSQLWTWSVYDWNTQQWIKIGDSMGVNADQWKTLLFPIRNFLRYISPGGEIRIQLQSNNVNGDAKVDYEALHITYLSIPATPTPVMPVVTPNRPGISSAPTATPSP